MEDDDAMVSGDIDGGAFISETEEMTNAGNTSSPAAAAAVIGAASAMEDAIREQDRSDRSPQEPSFMSDSDHSETVGDGETGIEPDGTQEILENEVHHGKETTESSGDDVCSCCGELDCDAGFDCKGEGRLLIIVNKLPFEAAKELGVWALQDVPEHTSHLYHCLSGSQNIIWMGSIDVKKQGAGANVLSDEDKNEIREQLRNMNCIPIFIEGRQLQNWKTYCGAVLRPLFYYSILEFTHTQKVQVLFEDYVQTSLDFRSQVIEVAKKGDTILIFGYHLMLLPMYLCSSSRKRIGWFCHSPFPLVTALDMLPMSTILLEGVLHSHAIGFSSVQYRKQFIEGCKQVLHAKVREDYYLEYEKKMTILRVFPLGIDVQRVRSALWRPNFHSQLARIVDTYQGRKVVLAVDVTQKSSGITEKILAFGSFLDSNKSWLDKVVFVLICLSSEHEGSVERSAIRRLIKKINRRYRSLASPPILMLDRMDLTLEQLCAYYCVADLFLCTPLRDGINGSCLEFLASRFQNAKVIVSRFAAIAPYITDINMAINPLDIVEFACLIKSRLEGDANIMTNGFDYDHMIFRPHRWIEAFRKLLWTVPAFSLSEEREHYILGQLHGKASRKVLAFKFESSWEKVVFTREDLVHMLKNDFEAETVERYLALDTGIKDGDVGYWEGGLGEDSVKLNEV